MKYVILYNCQLQFLEPGGLQSTINETALLVNKFLHNPLDLVLIFGNFPVGCNSFITQIKYSHCQRRE